MGAERTEYLKLTLRQLACGKVRLDLHVHAAGSVFCVEKTTGMQRGIWDGGAISAAALRPPPSIKLASPACFVDLLSRPGEDVFLSKRDIQTCLDAIKAPDSIQKFFGRPPVTVEELLETGLIAEDVLRTYIADST
eukprot:TRINITY_DN58465_c0_g1_i1.p1 TRINITY_DN58465_c0_g1~~TRINITY_DN58465_c0_g1_i1.p1  ORF type:complete len:136 (-),score=19.44 TRINITY_DN58465_c0_g1_i1:191-598(-)